MKTVDLLAVRHQTYGAKRLRAGDTFKATRDDAKILVAVGHAKLAPAPTVIIDPPVPRPAAKKAPAAYQRRDMVAAAPAAPVTPAAKKTAKPKTDEE
jgi:hypothetical protein